MDFLLVARKGIPLEEISSIILTATHLSSDVLYLEPAAIHHTQISNETPIIHLHGSYLNENYSTQEKKIFLKVDRFLKSLKNKKINCLSIDLFHLSDSLHEIFECIGLPTKEVTPPKKLKKITSQFSLEGRDLVSLEAEELQRRLLFWSEFLDPVVINSIKEVLVVVSRSF